MTGAAKNAPSGGGQAAGHARQTVGEILNEPLPRHGALDQHPLTVDAHEHRVAAGARRAMRLANAARHAARKSEQLRVGVGQADEGAAEAVTGPDGVAVGVGVVWPVGAGVGATTRAGRPRLAPHTTPATASTAAAAASTRRAGRRPEGTCSARIVVSSASLVAASSG